MTVVESKRVQASKGLAWEVAGADSTLNAGTLTPVPVASAATGRDVTSPAFVPPVPRPNAADPGDDDEPTIQREPAHTNTIHAEDDDEPTIQREQGAELATETERTIEREVSTELLTYSSCGLDNGAGLDLLFGRSSQPTIPAEDESDGKLAPSPPCQRPDLMEEPTVRGPLDALPSIEPLPNPIPLFDTNHADRVADTSVPPAILERSLAPQTPQVLSSRTRVRMTPLLLFSLAGVLAGAMVSLAVAYSLQLTPVASVPAQSQASTVPAASAPEDREVQPSIEELAHAGDPKALERLERIAEQRRTPVQVWAIHRGRSQQRREKLRALERSLSDAKTSEQRTPLLAKMRELAEVPDLAPEAVRALASVNDHRAVDALYDVWVGRPEVTPITQLARRFLQTAEVQSRATPSLRVAIELRGADSCERVVNALPRALKHADQRSVVPLVQIATRFPCNRGRAALCHPCLKGSVSLEDALRAAKRR